MDQADAHLRLAVRVERDADHRLAEEERAQPANANKSMRPHKRENVPPTHRESRGPPAAQRRRLWWLSAEASRATARGSMIAPNCAPPRRRRSGWRSLSWCAIACQQHWRGGRTQCNHVQFFQNSSTASVKSTAIPRLPYKQ
jgi:hypothetical protein